MASSPILCGFVYPDGYFFNVFLDNDEEILLKSGQGHLHLNGMANSKANQMELNLQGRKEVKHAVIGGVPNASGDYLVGALLNPDHMEGSNEEDAPLFKKTTENDVETKDSNFWHHPETMLLIEEHSRHKDFFATSSLKKMEVWQMISVKLTSRGHNKTATQCEKKWRNLKNSYKTCRERQSKSGAGRVTWSYYDQIDDQLFNDPSCQPKKTVGSLCGTQLHTERPRNSPIIQQSQSEDVTFVKHEEEPTQEERVPNQGNVKEKGSRKRKRIDRDFPDWFRDQQKQTNDLLQQLVATLAESVAVKKELLKKMNEREGEQ